jgi:DNA-binding NarL/FixJ family response regulator
LEDKMVTVRNKTTLEELGKMKLKKFTGDFQPKLIAHAADEAGAGGLVAFIDGLLRKHKGVAARLKSDPAPIHRNIRGRLPRDEAEVSAILKAVAAGTPRVRIADEFGVSVRTIGQYVADHRD